MKNENNTPIYNNLLEDKNLSCEEKLVYCLLMRYQRFEGKEKTFLSWLSSKGLRAKTFSKYVKSLQAKKYIQIDSVGDYIFYAINKENEVINYNNQNFKKFYSENYYTPVRDEILFSSEVKTPFQKLALIILERELKKAKDLKGYKIHLSTIGNILNVEEVSKKLKPLLIKGIISYDLEFTSRSYRSSFISNLVINFEKINTEIEVRSLEEAPLIEADIKPSKNIKQENKEIETMEKNITKEELQDKKRSYEKQLEKKTEELKELQSKEVFPVILANKKNEIDFIEKKLKNIKRIFELLPKEAPKKVPEKNDINELLMCI